jgi:hypothetical protein
MSNKQKQTKQMSTENGEIQDVEIMPDFENEMIEDMSPPKKKGCGCQKNKMAEESPATNTNWMRIALIVGGLVVVYFLFKGKKGKIEVPKVEVPEV